LPPLTGNELRTSKLPPFVRPTESSAVPSSIEYVKRGVLASNDLSNECFLAFGSFCAGARKALAGASEGELPGTRITSLRSGDAGLKPDAARFKVWLGLAAICLAVARLRDCASANGIAHTATSRSR